LGKRRVMHGIQTKTQPLSQKPKPPKRNENGRGKDHPNQFGENMTKGRVRREVKAADYE